jgi:hypothetical protein
LDSWPAGLFERLSIVDQHNLDSIDLPDADEREMANRFEIEVLVHCLRLASGLRTNIIRLLHFIKLA